MLNSLLFPDYPQLTNAEILNNAFIRPSELINYGIIKTDMICKVRLKDEDIILGVKIQIGVLGDIAERIFKCSIWVGYKHDGIPPWKNEIFIDLNQEPKCVELSCFKIGGVIKLNYINIVEIDLKEEIKKN